MVMVFDEGYTYNMISYQNKDRAMWYVKQLRDFGFDAWVSTYELI